MMNMPSIFEDERHSSRENLANPFRTRHILFLSALKNPCGVQTPRRPFRLLKKQNLSRAMTKTSL